jgi:putative addiction module killer protein
MAELELRSFVERNGRVPFQIWVDHLDKRAQAKVAVALTRLSLGNRSNVKGLGGGVAELKVDFGPGYRIYFAQDGATIVVLLAGGTKKRQDEDIASAKTRWAEYKERKALRRP